MKSTVLDRMFRVKRFRFALRRRTDANISTGGLIPAHEERLRASDQHDSGIKTGFGGEKKTFWVNRRIDLALIPCMWVG